MPVTAFGTGRAGAPNNFALPQEKGRGPKNFPSALIGAPPPNLKNAPTDLQTLISM